jgi:uncharacterized membrane protein
MPLTLLLVLILLLGAVAGLRTMTAPAVVCWGAHFGWLSLSHSPLSFLTSIVSLVIFTLLAIGELIGDKLPSTPSRLSIFPLVARVVFGALSGAAVVITAGAPLGLGLGVGAVGALIGAFVGYHVRHALTARAGLPDLPIALLEDLIAIGGGLFLVSRF